MIYHIRLCSSYCWVDSQDGHYNIPLQDSSSLSSSYPSLQEHTKLPGVLVQV